MNKPQLQRLQPKFKSKGKPKSKRLLIFPSTPGMPSPNLGRGTLLVDGYSSSYDDVSELGHLI